MLKVAVWSASDRRDLFQEVSTRRGLSFDVVQKDFWVCFVLDRLFSLETIGKELYFKGGTSLSKCFDIIGRFSEDVDLTIGREALGFEADYLDSAPSKSQQKKRRKEVQKRAFDYASKTILPALEASIAQVLTEKQEWKLIDSEEGVIRFQFPSDPDLTESAYLSPEVRLELGGLSDLEPNELMGATSYAAETFPDQFADGRANVRVVLARRTLCDKLLLLHRLNTADAELPKQQSRHYYDVAMLANSAVGTELREDLTLLAQAIRYEGLTFPRAGIDYASLSADQLRLAPEDRQLESFRRDYEAMKEMFFTDPPSVDWILEKLRELQDALASPRGT
jgi:hypothetical protein